MPAHDYRAYLKAIGRRPVVAAKLRTAKAPGTVEIVRNHPTGEHVLHRYVHPLLED